MTPERQYVLLEQQGPIGIITINRPKQLNALNMALLAELQQAMNHWEQNELVRVIVLTGSGDKAFVAGADIAAMAEMDEVQANEFAHQGHNLMRVIELCSKPVIASINGFALGGGLELALACDLLIAADNAKLGLPETKLGLYPGFGGTQRLPRLIGVARAKELIFSGRMLTAREALEWGLVNRVVSAAELVPAVRALCHDIAANGPHAIALAKQVISDGWDLPFAQALQRERSMFSELFRDHDHREGLKAFLDKRTPQFTGK